LDRGPAAAAGCYIIMRPAIAAAGAHRHAAGRLWQRAGSAAGRPHGSNPPSRCCKQSRWGARGSKP